MAARRGRMGGIEEARELAALIGALDAENNVVDAEGIARRLGCNLDHARHLLMILLQLQAADETPIPLSTSSDELDSVQLFYGRGVKGRPLRLSKTESDALAAALMRMGYQAESPLVQTLTFSVSNEGEAERQVRQTLVDISSPTATIEVCSEALAHGRDLSFDYVSRLGSATSGRRVTPRALRSDEGNWYLDAYDHDRAGERAFRLDRMANVQVTGTSAVPALIKQTPKAMVEVTFAEEWPLLLFEWPGIEIDEKSAGDGSRNAKLPHYGGSWLVRHLAACGSAVIIHDEALAQEVRSYASCEERHICR